MKKSLLYILFLLAIMINAHASSLTLTTSRDIYSVKETVQAEIITDIKPLNKVSINNLQLINQDNNGIPVQYFIEELSDQHYFVYFNIPDLEKGSYKFQVKNIQFIEDNSLKQVTEAKEINIYKLNPGFDFLASKQNNDGSFNTISETALAALALKNIHPDKAEKAINYLLNNQDPQGCYPRNNCNSKDTSFALLALKEFNKETAKTRNYLLDAQNNFNIGKWTLTLDSGNSICAVNNNQFTVKNKTEINIDNPSININCTIQAKITLTHSYLGNLKTIYNAQTNKAIINIDNSGCFGKTYRTACDYESTALAIYVLQQLKEQPSTEWLEKNPSDTKTLDQAFLYIIKNNEYSKNWLLNNIITNKDAWSYTSAAISQNIDTYSSIFATLAIINIDKEQYKRSLYFLEKKTTDNVLNSALISYFFFNSEIKQPKISIYPGIINNKDSFKLIIKNQDNIPVVIYIHAPNFTKLPKDFTLTDTKVFDVNIPLNSDNFNIQIAYGNNSYSIPVITKKYLNTTAKQNITMQEEIPIIPPPKDSIILRTKRNYINETYFKEDFIIKEFNFTNKWGHPLTNITFILTGDLNSIIELENKNFDSLHPEEIKIQRMMINKDKDTLGTYSGDLVIISEQGTITTIPIALTFTEKISRDETQKETISEEIKKTENKTGKEEIKKKSQIKKKRSYLVWLIPLIIIIIVLIVILILFRKQGKETFDKYLEGIKRE